MKILKYIFLLLTIMLLVGFSANKGSDYIKKLKTLTQVIKLINQNYVDEVDMNEVLDGAIIGLLAKF